MTTIPKFFQGQDVFITGGTGFLGKVLMEKLLRSCPDVGNIYILIRPKRGKDLNERIEGFTNDALFDTLKREHPNNLKKIVPVLGNLMEHDLGLSSFDHQMLEERVSIVFHLAATVRFNEPLKNAIIKNTRSTRDIMILARNMKKLKTLIHVSTTYCNCDRPVAEEIVYPTVYDWREMIMMADTVSDEHIINILTKKILGEFPNTYTFTKRLAENVVKDLGVGLPVGIVRPSIVTPSLSEPFIGWVDNSNGIHGVGICIFKGILRSLHGSPSAIVNYIPVDTVVKIMCTSSFEVAKSRNKLEPAVYSASNPSNHTWGSLVDYSTELANENPLENVIWKPDANINSNRIYHFMLVLIRQLIPALLFDVFLKLSGKKPMLLEIQRKTLLALKEIHYFLNHTWTFKNKNASSLSEQLHSSDKEHFDFNGFEDHDLKEYLSESLSGGVRFFVMKEAKYSTEDSRRHYRRMFWLDFIVKVIGVSLAIWCVYHSGYLQNLFHTFHTVWNAEI